MSREKTALPRADTPYSFLYFKVQYLLLFFVLKNEI